MPLRVIPWTSAPGLHRAIPCTSSVPASPACLPGERRWRAARCGGDDFVQGSRAARVHRGMTNVAATVRETVYLESLSNPGRCQRALDAIRNLCEAATARRLLELTRARQEELLGLR